MQGDGKDVVPSLILPGFWLEKVPVQAEGFGVGFPHERHLLPLPCLPKLLSSFKPSLLFACCSTDHDSEDWCLLPQASSSFLPQKGSEIQLSVPRSLPGAGLASLFPGKVS